MRTERQAQAGFTMIEAIVSLGIASIAMAGMVALYMTQTNAARSARQITEASTLAEALLEDLRIGPAAAAAAQSDPNPVDALGRVGGPYTRTWSTTAVGAAFVIQASVAWTDDEGDARSVVLATQRVP